jgi:hypothetical protein
LCIIGVREEQGSSVEKTTNEHEGNGDIFGDAFAMVEAHMTFTTIKTGETHITTAAKLFTNCIQGEDRRRESGSVIAMTHAITNGIISRDAKKANGSGKMGGVVGNLESGDAMTFGYPFKMSEKVKSISSAGHSTTIHMSTGRGVVVKEHFFLLELLVDMRTSYFHRTDAKRSRT